MTYPTFHERFVAFSQGHIPDPIQVEIHPTDICNHACVWCVALGERKKGLTMSREQLLKLVHDLGASHVMDLLFSGGGDPLAHPAINDALHIAASYGMTIEIVTNGGLLNASLRDVILATCHVIRISIDAGDDATYAHIHRPTAHGDSWQQTLEHLTWLLDHRQSHTKVVTSFVLHEKSYASLSSFLHTMEQIGVDAVDIKTNFFAPASVARNLRATADEIITTYQEQGGTLAVNYDRYIERRGLSQTVAKHADWPMLLYRAVIDSHGDLYPCCHLLGNPQFFQGNVFKPSFREVWYAPERFTWLSAATTREDGCRVCIEKTPNQRLNAFFKKQRLSYQNEQHT